MNETTALIFAVACGFVSVAYFLMGIEENLHRANKLKKLELKKAGVSEEEINKVWKQIGIIRLMQKAQGFVPALFFFVRIFVATWRHFSFPQKKSGKKEKGARARAV